MSKENAWYKVEQVSENRWEVTKAVDGYPPVFQMYQVANTGRSLSCSCFAGRKPTCRHRQMIPIFQKNAAIGTGALYCFDTKQWREPVPPDEEV